jgi:ubiquinone/menaquinone biosynthesis C-methylase UbiE
VPNIDLRCDLPTTVRSTAPTAANRLGDVQATAPEWPSVAGGSARREVSRRGDPQACADCLASAGHCSTALVDDPGAREKARLSVVPSSLSTQLTACSTEGQQVTATAAARRLLTLTGEERALDVGTGAGAFAIALAPFVREVVGVDIVPELLEEGRKRAPANVELVGADSTALPYERGSFDLVCTARTLHHIQRPELVLAEMNRVLRPGGTMLVVDQLAPIDSLAAIELNRFERARDPSTTRILADVDLRGFFEANGLVLRQAEIVRENRDLERYLDLAGRHGDERERARPVAPRRTSTEIGWYVVHKPGF